MMREFETYERLKVAGVEPYGACLKAMEEGANHITATKMLREVYGLDLVAAKSVMIRVDSGDLSLAEYQETLLPALREVLRE